MTDARDWGYFAGGAWHEARSARMIDSVNPTNAGIWARVPECDADDVDHAVKAAQAAFERGPFAAMNARVRGVLLHRMADAVRRNADRLAWAKSLDNGKSLPGMQDALTGWMVDYIDYYAGLADKIEGAVIPVDVPDTFNYKQRAPFGVVACITAWNFPLLIAIWKISAAIAAGNTVVIKPSKFASVSTLVLMDVLADADLPAELVNVVTGGANTGAALVNHNDVRLISSTGGVTGGRAVAKAASEAVKPETYIGPIANRPHFDRVLAAIKKGKADGAAGVLDGEAVSPESCAGWFVAPTIFTDVIPDMALACEEIFGPLLAVLPVKDDAEAIQSANDSDFGLAACIWTGDSLRAMKLAERIGAGTVYFSTYFGSAPQSPVGGFKQSGYGRENGMEGLLAFTQKKPVWLATDPAQAEPFA